MKIFQLENGVPTLTAETLLIPEFKKLYDRDKSKDKSKVIKELAYIYFSTDYQSIYLSYTKGIREERLNEDFMDTKLYKPDALVLAAIQKYDELQQTPTMNFLKAARNAMQATEEYFNGVDYYKLDSTGKPFYKGTEVTKMLKDCSGIKDSIDKLIEAVKKEQSNGVTQRGGGVGGLMEMED